MNRASLVAQAREILDKAAAEGREPTADELARSEAAWAAFDRLEDQVSVPFDPDAEWTPRG